MVWEESWGLVWEWGSFTSIISRAPSASLAESGTSAFPRLGALLGTLPVVGFGDGAVLVVWVSASVFGPVTFPELLGIVVVLSVGWDEGMAETNRWWGTVDCGSGSNESREYGEFHLIY